MTIKIEDNIPDLLAVNLVSKVIEQGKISGNGEYYCCLTLFETNDQGEIAVLTQQYRKSPCFKVYRTKSK